MMGDRPAIRAVERILWESWVPWMHGKSGIKPDGCPRRASGGLRNYTSLDWDSEAAYDGLDQTLAEKCDAVIRSMSPVEQCAIHHTYLNAVFRFNREPIETVLDRAMMKLEIGLRARNVWLG